MFQKLLFYNCSRLFQNFLKKFHVSQILFHKFFQKLTQKVTKFPLRMSKNLYKVLPTFLQNFFAISLKLKRNVFNILRNFCKINNLKLHRCFSIIFPEIIQNLLFLHFIEVFRRFCGNILNNSTK